MSPNIVSYVYELDWWVKLILIYLVGVVVTYHFIKFRLKGEPDYRTWKRVRWNFYMSLFSWLFLVKFTWDYCRLYVKKVLNSKPPRIL